MEEPVVSQLEVTEVIIQTEKAIGKTLTGEILNTLAIKEREMVLQDHLMGETQTIIMMGIIEMTVTKTMIPLM